MTPETVRISVGLETLEDLIWDLRPGTCRISKGRGMKKTELGESPVVIAEGDSVGLVETKHYSFAHPPNKFVLENGRELGPITVAYETYGELNKSGDNVILIEHALTASSHAAGKNSPEDKNPGWWDVMIGPGKAIDTDKYFVICSNILGSCYGTTGPSSIES